MQTPREPFAERVADRHPHARWTDAPANPLPPVAAGPANAPSTAATWRDDLPGASTLLRHTVAIALLAAGLLEYIGWQIARRAGDSSTVVPMGEWAMGMMRNFSGAAGVGVALALVVLLFPSSRKRPLRAASAAFTFGVAAFLGALAFLVSLAP